MTYAFFNFNTYLGGGETLIVRLAEYLKKTNYGFKVFYKTGSYIEKDLARIKIEKDYSCPIGAETDYYYLNNKDREKLREEICSYLNDKEDICLVSLCARDLYTLTDIAKNNPRYKLAHLVLHNQDNLYVCQSLVDKLTMKLRGERRFSRKNQIAFNRALFNTLCNQSIVIPQSELQAELLKDEFDIATEKEKAVPLPVCDFSEFEYVQPENNKKIIWIGRIVDFKLPALIVMLNFVSRHNDYSLTVVGDGDLDYVKNYMRNNSISDDNITFVGKINYGDLETIIKQHSVGYAMGTSIIEIGKYGLPVIMALGSPDFKLYDKDICGGLYCHQSRGNVGDTMFYKKSKDPVLLIDVAFAELESDYEKASRECYDELKSNFDEETDFQLYMKLLSQANSITTDLTIPKASWIRRVMFHLF